MIKKIYTTIRSDIQSALERDPAARGAFEIILAYPGFHAVVGHRIAHWFWRRKRRLIARWLSHFNRFLTGIEIHPGAQLGAGLFIDHGMGVVIGETSEVGRNVTIYHGVTLGGVSLEKGKRHPTIEDNVVIGAGAKVLGNITIGQGSRIGANAVVVNSAPPNSVVVGVPGQIVLRSKPANATPDLAHNQMPDAIGKSLASVMARIDALEQRAHTRALETAGGSSGKKTGGRDDARILDHPPLVHPPDHGVWRGEDFSI